MNKHFLKSSKGGGLAVAVFLAAMPSFAQNVTVTNPTDQPVPVKEVRVPGTTPLQIELDFDTKYSNYSTNQLFAAAGRLAVIEHASVYASCAYTARADLVLTVKNPQAVPAQPQPASVFAATVDVQHMWAAQPMKFYVAAGGSVQVVAVHNPIGGICSGSVTLLGHWEDVPLTGISILPR
jgi:hypothetical protein